jgi:hypothetical protein
MHVVRRTLSVYAASLFLTRNCRGAEGTIIEEPDSLSRMIWGLDPDTQSLSSKERQQATPALPAAESEKASQPSKPPVHRRPVTIKAPPSSDSENRPLLPPAATSGHGRHAQQDTKGTESSVHHITAVGHRVRHAEAVLDDVYVQNLPGDTLPRHRADERFYDFNRYQDVPHSKQAHDFSHPMTVGHMKVISRPAPGSALPQIFIEPRSPESFISNRHSLTALEAIQQYQQSLARTQQQSPLLPTPPSSSSSLWSSNFSPYTESLPSPALPFFNASEQIRRLVHDRLADMASPPLAPAAQIDSYPVSYPTSDFNELSSPRELLNYLARRELFTSQTTQAPVPPQKTRTFSGHSQSTYTSAGSHNRHHSSSLQYAPPPPIYPELNLHVSRGYTTHQPRSIPLTRLIQRRLSAVPEEDTSSTVRGRSPSPVPRGFEDRAHARRQPSGPSSDVIAHDYAAAEPRARVRLPGSGGARAVQEAYERERPQRTPVGPRTRTQPRGPLGPGVCDDREPETAQREAFRKKTPRGGNGTAATGAGKPPRKMYGASIAGRI